MSSSKWEDIYIEDIAHMKYGKMPTKDKLDIYNGQGTVFGSINKGALSNMIFVKPNKSITYKFNKIAYSLDQQYLCHVQQNKILKNIRDTFLPKLMSGEIRVPIDRDGERFARRGCH